MKIDSVTAPNPGPLTLDGTRTYILDERIVIDPGPLDESHLQAILDRAPRLDTILITHRHADHAPAAVPLRERAGTRILAPNGVLDDSVVDQRLSGGEFLDVVHGANWIGVAWCGGDRGWIRRYAHCRAYQGCSARADVFGGA